MFLLRLKLADLLRKLYRLIYKWYCQVNPVGFSEINYRGEPVISPFDDGEPVKPLQPAIQNHIIQYVPKAVPKNHEWERRISYLRELAAKHEWREIDWQDKTTMISFLRDGVRMNIYYTKMTVGTAMYHPTKHATQLYRKGVSYEQLEKLMENPRHHTGKGYYRK